MFSPASSPVDSNDSSPYRPYSPDKSLAKIAQVRDLGAELTNLKVKQVALMSLWGVCKTFSYLSFTAPLAGHFRRTAPILCRYISTTIALVTGIYLFEKFVTTLFPKYNDWVECQITKNRKKMHILSKVYNRIEPDMSIPEYKSILDLLNPWYTRPLRVYPSQAFDIQKEEDLEAARESYLGLKPLFVKPQDVSVKDPVFYCHNSTKNEMEADLYKFLMTDFLPDVLKVCQNRMLDASLIDPGALEPKAVETKNWHEIPPNLADGLKFANLKYEEHAITRDDRPLIVSTTSQGKSIVTYKEFVSLIHLCVENHQSIEKFVDHLYALL